MTQRPRVLHGVPKRMLETPCDGERRALSTVPTCLTRDAEDATGALMIIIVTAGTATEGVEVGVVAVEVEALPHPHLGDVTTVL